MYTDITKISHMNSFGLYVIAGSAFWIILSEAQIQFPESVSHGDVTFAKVGKFEMSICANVF